MSSTASLTTMVTIDSADRNQVYYPNPADYTYQLPQPIRNAETVELMMFQMVRSEGSVNSGNTSFTVQKGAGAITTVTIPQGTYTYGTIGSATDFNSTLQTALNSASSGFTVASNTTALSGASVLEISNSTSFQIVINTLTSRLLGISAAYDSSGVSNVTGYERGAGMAKSSGNKITGTKTPDMNGEPYIILSINDYHPNVSLSTPMLNGFITIPLENQAVGNRFSISNDLKEKKGVFKLGPTQTKVDKIKIQITRADGSLYDFKGYEHQIVLRVMRKDGQNFVA
jgi:hypothetical protein